LELDATFAHICHADSSGRPMLTRP
jgi:hypothetical protein